MDNRTLYYGSAAGTVSGGPFPVLQGREPIEAYTGIVQSSLRTLGSSLHFALIELIEFLESGDRRSSSVVFSNLTDSANASIIKRHYDIIQEVKNLPGMGWSTLSANEVQFGPVVFCLRKSHGPAVANAETLPETGVMKWSKPKVTPLPGNYQITDEPDEARVWAKLKAYADRVTAILPGPAGVLHVLVVPFSMLEAEGRGKKLGAACILVDAAEAIPDDLMQALYAKAQLFWLRFCANWSAVAEPARA